jgi:hypothetical protein
LTCEANGIPSPNVTWKRGDGFPLPGGGFQHKVNKTIRCCGPEQLVSPKVKDLVKHDMDE